MNPPTDFLGRAVHAGDEIAYCWRKGAKMGLNRLTLTQVTDQYVAGYNHLGHRVKITNFKHVVRLTPETV